MKASLLAAALAAALNFGAIMPHGTHSGKARKQRVFACVFPLSGMAMKRFILSVASSFETRRRRRSSG
jgi:hypothetical protein